MDKNFTLKGIVSLCLFTTLSPRLTAQNVAASPVNFIRPTPGNTITVALDRIPGNWGGSNAGNYVWTVSPATGVTLGSYTQTGSNAADVNAVFSSAANGAYTFTLTRGNRSASVVVRAGTMAASSSAGNSISAFSVNNGTYIAGPGEIFDPVVRTAALGLSTTGYYYYLPNNYSGNDGNVTVYAARPDGTGSTAIGSIDLNGNSNNDLGFVRLAVDPIGNGYILAGDNNTLYLGRFTTNGINPVTISVVDPAVTLVNGSIGTFYNGDICFSGAGTLYALGNSSNGGVTQIFTGTPNGTNTTLTKKWDLVNPNGNPFNVSVNGVAFDASGSLYISTANGLYYIDQNTVNTATGTVQCSLVANVSGLTDLASNQYPQLSTLPVQLMSFTGNYRTPSATLNWVTANEVNLDRFELERSIDGAGWSTIAIVFTASAGNSREQYQYTDNLSQVAGTAYMYRLKMIDRDGQFKYSPVVLLRKENTLQHITLNPNPVRHGAATVRFTAARSGNFDLRILDVSGKVVLQQQHKVSEGSNSIALNGAARLPAGTYILQITNGSELQTIKFIAVE